MATRDPNDRGSKDPGRNKSSSTGTGGSNLGGALSKSYGKPGEDNIAKSEARQAGVGGLASSKQTEGGAGPKSKVPQQNLPTGVTPLSAPKPMGATPYVEGADWVGIGARILGGIGGAVGSALTQGLTGEDTTQSMLGEHLGKQVGWSADPSMTPGRDRAQRGAKRESFDQPTLGSATSTPSDESKTPAPAPTDEYSDIQMTDRRKPGLKQMLETML